MKLFIKLIKTIVSNKDQKRFDANSDLIRFDVVIYVWHGQVVGYVVECNFKCAIPNRHVWKCWITKQFVINTYIFYLHFFLLILWNTTENVYYIEFVMCNKNQCILNVMAETALFLFSNQKQAKEEKGRKLSISLLLVEVVEQSREVVRGAVKRELIWLSHPPPLLLLPSTIIHSLFYSNEIISQNIQFDLPKCFVMWHRGVER